MGGTSSCLTYQIKGKHEEKGAPDSKVSTTTSSRRLPPKHYKWRDVQESVPERGLIVVGGRHRASRWP